MSILDEIRVKAEGAINDYRKFEPMFQRQTNLYNAAENKIVVAGFPLDGVVSFSISSDVYTKQEQGIDYNYCTSYQNFENRSLSVTILPTASCLQVLRNLTLTQQKTRGWFYLTVHENGRIKDTYKAWVLSSPQVEAQQEAQDRVFSFSVLPILTQEGVISEYTAYESRQQTQPKIPVIDTPPNPVAIQEVTQSVENIPNTTITVAEGSPVGSNLKIVPNKK